MSAIVSETTVSEQCEFVTGVDTDVATHTYALVAAATGALLAHAEFQPVRPGRPAPRAGSSSGPAIGSR